VAIMGGRMTPAAPLPPILEDGVTQVALSLGAAGRLGRRGSSTVWRRAQVTARQRVARETRCWPASPIAGARSAACEQARWGVAVGTASAMREA
jgi:hypothetical protein